MGASSRRDGVRPMSVSDPRASVAFLYQLAAAYLPLGVLEECVAVAIAAPGPNEFENEHAAKWAQGAADRLDSTGMNLERIAATLREIAKASGAGVAPDTPLDAVKRLAMPERTALIAAADRLGFLTGSEVHTGFGRSVRLDLNPETVLEWNAAVAAYRKAIEPPPADDPPPPLAAP